MTPRAGLLRRRPTRSTGGQPLTPLELAAWQGMLRVSFRLRTELGRALQQAHGLSMANYDLLVRLAEQPDGQMRMAGLADAILQPRSSLTRMAGNLQHRGLIQRRPAPDDGRGALAALTKAGRRTFRAAQRTHLGGVRRHFHDQLSDDQLRQLAKAWTAVG